MDAARSALVVSPPSVIAMKRAFITAMVIGTGALALAVQLPQSALGRATPTGLGTAPALAIDSLVSPAAAGSAEPNLSVGPDGRVYMTWLEPTNPGHALRFSVHDGTKWSAAQTIVQRSDLSVNWADFPSLVVLDGGRLAAHWLQRNGAATFAYGVRISQSADAGKTWSAPVVPHRDSSEKEHGFVALWNERGTLGAVWLDGRKFKAAGHDVVNEMMLVTTTLRADGTRGAEVRLDERTCDCCQNAAAMTSSGPIIAYRNRSDAEIRDIYVTRRVGTKWITGTPVHNDQWKIAACPVNGPALAARENRVALAWFTAPGDSARVNVAFSDNSGATFGAPVRVDAGTPAGRVDVALLPDGGALVTWVERTGGDVASVQARRVGPDGKAGIPMTIASSSAARASGFPHAVITGNNVMFAWTLAGRPSAVRVARAPLTEFR